MRKTISFLLAFCMIFGIIFTSCDQNEAQSTSTTSEETSASLSDTNETDSETDALTSSESSTDTKAETETEVETDDNVIEEATLDISEFNVDPTLPQTDSVKYECGDGAMLEQFSNIDKSGFLAACAYYLSNGYSAYSKNAVGETSSLVVTKGDEVITLFYTAKDQKLNVTSGNGAELLPDVDFGYTKICEVAITQRYSTKINGMGYAIQLEDGSFIVYDGGYDVDADDLYKALYGNNKTDGKVHIRAWLLTHSHNDHYPAFEVFANKYAKKVIVDTVLYAPANNLKTVTEEMEYFTKVLPTYVKKFDGAELCPIHTGMSFNMGGVKLEVLYTSEYVAMNSVLANSNETSVVSRVANADGSIMFTADVAIEGCKWLINTYGDALKSDMVQISHHGVENAPAEFYDKIAAPLLFWPCSESLMGQYRGELVKQHLLEADYSVEHILQGYGTVTRLLSYKPRVPEMIDLFPKNESLISDSKGVENIRIDNGVLKYTVKEADPYVSIDLSDIDTGKCNMIKIVADPVSCKGSSLCVTSVVDGQTNEKKKSIGEQGTSDDGKMTLIVYLGNIKNFEGNLTSIRLNFGSEAGQEVEIYSIEAYYVDMESEQ